MSELRDAQDAARVLAGDPEAYESIVLRWQGPLVTLAFRFCRDRHRAEDMAQVAFVTAFRKLDQWRRDGSFRGWLLALALNVFRSELRRPRVAFGTLTAEPQDPASAGRASGDDDDRVRRLVGALPPRYRDVLVLFYFHERDLQQTAAQLGLPAGTVKARLHRGRALLRRAWTASPPVR